MKKTLIFLILISISFSQQYEDVVILKNGSEIYGVIIEQKPNEYIKIKSGKNIFVFQMDEIDIIKIDTQGYEDKVLIGCKKMIEEKKIKFIELEIILSDIYDKTLSISDIESQLKNNYRLFE